MPLIQQYLQNNSSFIAWTSKSFSYKCSSKISNNHKARPRLHFYSRKKKMYILLSRTSCYLDTEEGIPCTTIHRCNNGHTPHFLHENKGYDLAKYLLEINKDILLQGKYYTSKCAWIIRGDLHKAIETSLDQIYRKDYP